MAIEIRNLELASINLEEALITSFSHSGTLGWAQWQAWHELDRRAGRGITS